MFPHLFATHLSSTILLLYYTGHDFLFQTSNNHITILVKNVIEGNITFARPVYNASVKEVINRE
jgi:hypothetical protein